MQKKGKKYLFYSAISLGIVASIVLSGFTLYGQNKTYNMLKTSYGEVEDVNKEDDVTIGGQFVIKSTLPISDAYKSGDTSKLDDFEKETLDLASDVLKDIIKDGMTDFEKEKEVYLWLTSKLTHTSGILTVVPAVQGEYDNPHDVLKYHSAVCVGFATTFRLFMQMMDIECKVVHSSDLTHSWDLVKLDDGWYHTDCYMDNESPNYQNFNMDDNRCRMGHDWTADYFPAATGQKYNYILSIAEEIKDIYAVPKWFINAVNKKKSVISCTFKNDITEKTEPVAQYMVEQLTMSFDADGSVSITYDWMQNSDGKYVLCMYIDYMNDSVEVDDETMEKVNDSINKAIGDYQG